MKPRPKRKKISQAEAWRLRGRVRELEQRLQDQINPYPDGVTLSKTTHPTGSVLVAKVNASRALGHAVIVVADGDELRYIGIRAP